MDTQTLLYTVLLTATCFIVGTMAEDDTPKYECYECTFYHGMAMMNPNCEKPLDSGSKAPIREGCEICSERIYKGVYKNTTRTYIKRSCTRLCKHEEQFIVQYQDLQNVKATEYCCTKDLCNTGSGSTSIHQMAAKAVFIASVGMVLLRSLLRGVQ